MPPARTRRRAVAALLAAAALALSACDGGQSVLGGDDDPQDTSPSATMSMTSPLTGETLRDLPEHPILAVKIDNSGSNSQIGLGRADMVVEELVEGGITRLATFFYSQMPADVGPVRSIRATDIGIVAPLDALLVASGAAPPTTKRVRNAGIRTVTEGGRGFYRGSGAAPYNLFVKTDKLLAPLKPLSQLPEPYLPFGDAKLPKGKPAKRFAAVFSPASDSSFQFRRGGYVNTDSYARGSDFVADSVLVLRVRVGVAGYRDPSGATVPETKFMGKGQATIFHDGRMITGTWHKKGLRGALRLKAGGKRLELPPGKVRVELVPNDTGALRVG